MAWGPRTLLEHMTALLAPLASSVQVLGRGGVPDRHPGRGPVEGVASAIAATSSLSDFWDRNWTPGMPETGA